MLHDIMWLLVKSVHVVGLLKTQKYLYGTFKVRKHPYSSGTMTETNKFRNIGLVRDTTVRPATLDDSPAIIALSKLTHTDSYATDYLPGWLPKLLQDQNRILLVAEKHGQMVGFGMILGGLDDGEYIIGEGARLHPALQGRRMFPFMQWHLFQAAEARWPQWKIVLAGSTDTQLLKKQKHIINIISQRMICRVASQSISEILAGKAWDTLPIMNNIRPHTCETFKRLLPSTTVIAGVYPDGWIPIEHLVYKAVPSNAEHIHHYHEHIFSSSEPDDDVAVNAISIGGLLPCDDGRAWRYNFNYSGKVDMQLYLSHLRQHLHAVHKRGVDDKTVYLVLVMPNVIGRVLSVKQVAMYLNVPEMNIVVLEQYIGDHFKEKTEFLNWKKVSCVL